MIEDKIIEKTKDKKKTEKLEIHIFNLYWPGHKDFGPNHLNPRKKGYYFFFIDNYMLMSGPGESLEVYQEDKKYTDYFKERMIYLDCEWDFRKNQNEVLKQWSIDIGKTKKEGNFIKKYLGKIEADKEKVENLIYWIEAGSNIAHLQLCDALNLFDQRNECKNKKEEKILLKKYHSQGEIKFLKETYIKLKKYQFERIKAVGLLEYLK
jgi:hypothetical protein